MNNNNLSKDTERGKGGLQDFVTTAEGLINDLVDEIEDLESQLSDAETTINGLHEQIENLTAQLSEK